MAEIRVYAGQATVGGGKLHLGATSMDIEDTVETFRLRRALGKIVEFGLRDQVRTLLRFGQRNPYRAPQLAPLAFGEKLAERRIRIAP